MTPYSQHSHYHCWDQKQPPACGQTTHHTVCCLCGVNINDMKTKIKVEPLESLIKKEYWYYVNSNLTTDNFPLTTTETDNPKIIKMSKSFSSQEALDEIKRHGCRPATAWELAQWSVNHRDEIKKGTYIIALGQLWQDSDGHHGVPRVIAYSDGDFDFDLGCFENDWHSDYCLLAFCDPALRNLDTQKSFDPLTLSQLFEQVQFLDNRVKKLEDLVNPELLKQHEK